MMWSQQRNDNISIPHLGKVPCIEHSLILKMEYRYTESLSKVREVYVTKPTPYVASRLI